MSKLFVQTYSNSFLTFAISEVIDIPIAPHTIDVSCKDHNLIGPQV